MNKFKKLPIAYQLWTMAVVIVLIISVIFFTSYYMISRSLIENNIVYTAQVCDQIRTNIEDKTSLLESLLLYTGYQRNVIQYIKETDNDKKYEQMKYLDTMSVGVSQIERHIQEIVIKGNNGSDYYFHGKVDKISKALEQIPERPNNYYNISIGLDYNSNGKSSFIVSSSIYDIYSSVYSGIYFGTISFIVDMDIIGISDFIGAYDMSLVLLDENNKVCASSKKIPENIDILIQENRQSIRDGNQTEIKANGREYIINTSHIGSMGATVLSLTPKENIIRSISWIQNITVYLLLLALTMIIILFMYFKHNITAPLKRFSVFMHKIENGSVTALKMQVDLDGYKEIEEISHQFNSMIAEINSLTHRLIKTMGTLYETELQKKQAELLFLKSQINPHFLFNTLEVIIGMSFMEEAPQTAEMIKSLSKIFKYCVRGSDTVTVSEELNMIKSYIHIQQTRFWELFDVVYEFDENVLSNQMPKMLLQPIVENAITHGFEDKGKKGAIHIGGCITRDGRTELWVEDNGVGMDEKQLSHLQSIISQEKTKRTDSIGLENIINRLQLLYSNHCEINIQSRKNEGTRIEIILPLYH